MQLDSWYLENLVCPIDHSSLQYNGVNLISSNGRSYPVIEGIPILLVQEVEQTIGVAEESIREAGSQSPTPHFYLDTLGISKEEKVELAKLISSGTSKIDPVVAFLIGATNGNAYKHLIGNISTYPIPELRLPDTQSDTFLDLGCNWGRWSIAAARNGYNVVGLDPSLGAILAARRVSQQLGLSNRYVVADARYLPFKSSSFNTIFSYSVLQHLSKQNTRIVVSEIARVLTPDGISLIQMPHFLGIRSLQHLTRRKFRAARDFEVRYWTIPQLHKTFSEQIGRTEISVDCYFGLGLQKSDLDLMSKPMQFVIRLSEMLRKLSQKLGILKFVADSLYVKSYSAKRHRPYA